MMRRNSNLRTVTNPGARRGGRGASVFHRAGWASLAAIAMLAGACGGGSPPESTGKATITFAQFESSGDDLKAQYAAMISDFQQKNPNITVNLEAIPIDQYDHQIITECAAGNCPDVSIAIGNDIALLSEAHLTVDLSSYAKDVLPTFASGPVKAAQYNGKQYALPWAAADIVLLYNRDIMTKVGLDPTKPPASITELMSDIATAKAKMPNVVGLGIDTSKRTISLDFQLPFLNAFGAIPIKDGKPNANTPQMVAYLDWIRAIMGNHVSLPGKNMGGFRALDAQGNVLFAEDGPWFKAVLQGQNKQTDDQIYATWGFAPIPGSPAPGVNDGVTHNGAAVGGDHQLVMMAPSKNKQAAWAFIKYLTTDPVAITQYDVSGGQGIPPTGKVVQGMNEGATKAFLDLYKVALVPPYGPHYAAAGLAFAQNIQKAYSTSESSAQIAQEMQQDMQTAFGG
jgi:multiple sugar transport system substrate-binding protein